MKLKRYLPVLLVIALLALAAVGVFKYVDINRQYPAAEKLEFQLNEAFLFDDFSLMQTETEILEYDEFIERYPDLQNVNFGADNDNLQFVLAKFHIENTSAETKSIVLYAATFSTLTYSNGIDTIMFEAVNGDNANLAPQLTGGESTDIVFTYSVVKTQAGDISNGRIYFNLYPQEISFLIN